MNTDKPVSCGQVGAVYMDVGKPFLLPDACADYVFSEHLFEHLTYPQAVNMLQESFRVLKPGGVIRIATPDLRFLLGLYQDLEKPLHKEYIAYSAQRCDFPATAVFVINRFHTAWGHKIIYDRETLSSMVQDADLWSCNGVKWERASMREGRGDGVFIVKGTRLGMIEMGGQCFKGAIWFMINC